MIDITFESMMARTEYMMQEIRRKAINETLEKFREANRTYYRTCMGGGEAAMLYKELECLGVDPEYLVEEDLRIRSEVMESI